MCRGGNKEKKYFRVSGLSSPDKWGSHTPQNKIGDEGMQIIKNHINSIHYTSSTYSRSHNNKKYLPTRLSLTLMYQMYKEKSANPVSYTYFGNVFHTMGLSFKKPSLDTCNTWYAYKMKIKLALPPDSETLKKELDNHHLEADSAYSIKKKDKEESSDVKSLLFWSATMSTNLNQPRLLENDIVILIITIKYLIEHKNGYIALET